MEKRKKRGEMKKEVYGEKKRRGEIKKGAERRREE